MKRNKKNITAINPSHHMRFQFRSRRLSPTDLCVAANQAAARITEFKDYVATDWLSPRHLGKLIELASYEIHGGLMLRVDGDCFQPPECWCTLKGWNGSFRAAGGTANEAILRAMLYREYKQSSLPASVERVDWSEFEELFEDKPHNQDLT